MEQEKKCCNSTTIHKVKYLMILLFNETNECKLRLYLVYLAKLDLVFHQNRFNTMIVYI